MVLERATDGLVETVADKINYGEPVGSWNSRS
jgi:hypothetical protein